MEIGLLLTGCIKPNVTDRLHFRAPEERKRQYVDAITWYLNNTPYRLMFVENSGTDISSGFAGFAGRTEFLTYKSEPTVPERSRRYKEMEILEYAYSHSRMLREMGGGN